MEFIEVPTFTRRLAEYLDDEGYRLFQESLMNKPEAGKVIPESGGLRKIRWADPRRGKGKRGGLRIIYFYFQEASHIWLLAVYDKDEADDLTPKQKKSFRLFVQDIRKAWAASKQTDEQ